jgi:hypothetical protein
LKTLTPDEVVEEVKTQDCVVVVEQVSAGMKWSFIDKNQENQDI